MRRIAASAWVMACGVPLRSSSRRPRSKRRLRMPVIGSTARRISDSSAAQSIVAMRKRVESSPREAGGNVVGALSCAQPPHVEAGVSLFAVAFELSMPRLKTL